MKNMDHFKNVIMANVAENTDLVQILPSIINNKVDIVSQLVLAFQLFPYYSRQYCGRVYGEDILQTQQWEDLFDYVADYQSDSVEKQNPKKNIYVSQKLKEKLNKLEQDNFDMEPLQDLYDLFMVHKEASYINPGVIFMISSIMSKYLAVYDRKQYFIQISQKCDHMFFKKIIRCDSQLFDIIQYEYIDSFQINNKLYLKQHNYIEKCRQATEQDAQYSTIYTCKKCKQKKCRFYPVQMKASDEETSIKVKCYNADCGYEWIH